MPIYVYFHLSCWWFCYYFKTKLSRKTKNAIARRTTTWIYNGVSLEHTCDYHRGHYLEWTLFERMTLHHTRLTSSLLGMEHTPRTPERKSKQEQRTYPHFSSHNLEHEVSSGQPRIPEIHSVEQVSWLPCSQRKVSVTSCDSHLARGRNGSVYMRVPYENFPANS